MDLDLRLIRYFVTVAEERSFTAAARRLHVSQPALSQQVRKLERLLGVELFDRSGHRVELTRPGHALLDEGRTLLTAAERATIAARRAAVEEMTLHVAFVVGTPAATTKVLLTMADRQIPGLRIQLKRVEWSEQATCLRDGRADLAIVQLPLSADDLDVQPIGSQPRVAVFPADHPLADRQSVSIADLRDEPILDATYNRDFWLVIPRPDGSTPRVTRAGADTVEEMLEQVAAGLGMCITTASVAESHGRRDLAVVPIDDIEPCVTALARTRVGVHPMVEFVSELLVTRLAMR
jgi:DNA-binding transcriptional LysR family regulator